MAAQRVLRSAGYTPPRSRMSRGARPPLQAPLSGSTPAAPSPSGYGAGDIWVYGNWGNPIQKLTGGTWRIPTQKENNDFVRGARDAAIAEGFEIPELEESSGWLLPNTELYKWISDGKPHQKELVGREGHWKFDENGKVVPAEVPTEEQKAEWNREWQAQQPPEVRPEPSGGIMLSNALSPEARRLGSGQGFNPTQVPAAQGFASTQMPASQSMMASASGPTDVPRQGPRTAHHGRPPMHGDGLDLMDDIEVIEELARRGIDWKTVSHGDEAVEAAKEAVRSGTPQSTPQPQGQPQGRSRPTLQTPYPPDQNRMEATLGNMFDNLKQSYPQVQLDERLSPNTFLQPVGEQARAAGGGLSTTQQIALMATLAALTGGTSGIAGGAMAGARALAPTVGRVAAPLGMGLLASLGLASPAHASGSSDVGDIRRQRALQSDRAAGRGRTRYQR